MSAERALESSAVTLELIPPDAAAAKRASGRLRVFARDERPSVLVGGVFAAFLIAMAVRLPWADDLMLHLAVLHHLIADPLHPGNPVLDTGGSSIYYSPYMLALALPGKAFGLSPTTLYQCAAVVNVLLLLTGLFRFVRTVSSARWAPPLAMIGLSLWWGTSAIGWSGFLSLLSLGETEAYPSTLATALALHLWAWLNRRDSRTLTSPARMAGVGALYGLIMLTHQFTAINATIGCAAILLSRHREVRTKTAARAIAVGIAACAAVVAVWPYFHLWGVSQGELDVLDPVHKALYVHMLVWFAMGLAAGIVALAFRWRRARMDVLVLLFLGAGAVVGYGKVTGHWSYGRSWPMVMLAAQLAVAVALAEARPGMWRSLWGALVAVMTAAGLMTQAGAAVYLLPASWQPSVQRLLKHGPVPTRAGVDDNARLDWLDPYLKPGDVIAADARDAQAEIAAHGAYGVTTPWDLPEVTAAQWATRNAAESALFAAGTPTSQRLALVGEYHVDWLLLTGTEQPPPGLAAQLTAQGDGFRLYHVGG
jgi:alpha-1,6-mannosyltransferase